MSLSHASSRATGERSTLFAGVASLIVLLVLLQAVLAGQWLAGHDTIRVHSANGLIILLLAVLQCIVVAVKLAAPQRKWLLLATGLFLVLVAVQVVLGFAGYDTANQARAFHVADGVLLFGLSVWIAGQALRGSSTRAG